MRTGRLQTGAAAIAALAALSVAAPSAQAAVDDDGLEVPVTTTIPLGCPIPPSATAVFVGEVTVTDSRTARFRIDAERAGSLDGHRVEDLVDVDYEEEVRFISVGETYLVGVGENDDTGRLYSSVREPAPLFGGDQVAGLDDIIAECPEVESPIRTLMLDGSPVESAVIAPLLENKRDLLAAVVLPAIWVFLGLVALAAVKNLLWASGREMSAFARRRR